MIRSFLFFLLIFHFYLCHALEEKQPVHFSGDKQIWDRKINQVELIGHATVSQPGETLTADHVFLNLNSRELKAKGNCIYIAKDSVIYGDEMRFDLNLRTGSVEKGRVSNESFTLRGEKINKLGPGHFQTHQGDYTTCRDCDASWSLQAEDVNLEVGGYAYLTNVVARIKDTPAFWLPAMIVPVKTGRQTGLLFPTFAFSSNNGATFVLPAFWAINRSLDMTFGAGFYSERGKRFEWETRYAYSPRSTGTSNFFFLSDRTFEESSRWAINLSQTHELPWNIEEKLRLAEVSDNLYPGFFPNDVPSIAGEAFAPSTLSFSKTSSEMSAYLSFQRYRNLLNSTPGDLVAQKVSFDSRTVQAFPSALVTTNDQFLGNTGMIGGLTLGFTNFTRGTTSFDYDGTSVPFGSVIPANQPVFRPGIDPIRKATRFSMTPSVYTTIRPFDVVSVVPSLQYRQYFYNFGHQVPNLYRGYLLFQTDLSTQVERIFDFPEDPDVPRAKHLIRPMLTYSYIPYIREDVTHPFTSQIRNAQDHNISGYNFDNNDIIPYGYTQSSANYFVPLGHSIAYGFTTNWIRRRNSIDQELGNYQNVFELRAGQSLNLLELSKPKGHLFSRFFSVLNLNFDHFVSQTSYYYYPDIFPSTARHTVSTNISYFFERGFHHKILTYDRSFTLGYAFNKINGNTSSLQGTLNFSLSDYVLPSATVSYGFEPVGQYLGAGLGIALQSPSRCWKLTTGSNYNVTNGLTFTWDLSLNLTGNGFGGITEIANQFQSTTH